MPFLRFDIDVLHISFHPVSERYSLPAPKNARGAESEESGDVYEQFAEKDLVYEATENSSQPMVTMYSTEGFESEEKPRNSILHLEKETPITASGRAKPESEIAAFLGGGSQYFHGSISREDSEDLINSRIKSGDVSPPCFLVRTSQESVFVISRRGDSSKIAHWKLASADGLLVDKDGNTYSDLVEALQQWKSKGLLLDKRRVLGTGIPTKRPNLEAFV